MSPGTHSIWIVGDNPKDQVNCFDRPPADDPKRGQYNFYSNALCKKYAKDFALKMSTYKGKPDGLTGGGGRYLKQCHSKADASWVRPAGCDDNHVTPPPPPPPNASPGPNESPGHGPGPTPSPGDGDGSPPACPACAVATLLSPSPMPVCKDKKPPMKPEVLVPDAKEQKKK